MPFLAMLEGMASVLGGLIDSSHRPAVLVEFVSEDRMKRWGSTPTAPIARALVGFSSAIIFGLLLVERCGIRDNKGIESAARLLGAIQGRVIMSVKAILTLGLFVGSVLAVGGCSRRAVVAVAETPEKTEVINRLDVATLTSALEDPDADVRFYAVLDLADYKDEAAPAVTSLGKLLKDPRETTRSAAADTLGAIGPEAAPAASSLAAALADQNPDVRRSAAVALGRIGSKASPAVDALSKAVLDFDEDVRLAAIDALGKIGPSARSAVAVLLRAMEDGDEIKRQRARRSIQQIDPGAIARVADRPTS